ncbi:MAG TPA: biotin transporter BioY [Acidimicrobiia bacterium]
MAYAPAVLAARVLPRSRVVTVALVVTFALLTALAAQISIPLGFTPVPITGQTFAVLLSGAVLGARAGAASQLLYVGMGAIGLPFYAEQRGGWEVVTGATGGYLIGFVFAAAAVGYLAELRQDRRFATSVGAFLSGNLVIYLFGVPGLMVVLDTTLEEALILGLVPFIPGDLLKLAAASALLPTAWKLLGERR